MVILLTLIGALIGLIIAIFAWVAVWAVVSALSASGERQVQFLGGSVPSQPPDGFYRGAAYLLGNRRVPWLGKSFEPQASLGYNIFTPRGASLLKAMTPLYKRFRPNADGNTIAYDFKTSTGPGFKDKGIETFKLDYDSPENPFLIRIILDEIVEVAPDHFLGKVHLKVFPGYYATIGFFGLRKDTAKV